MKYYLMFLSVLLISSACSQYNERFEALRNQIAENDFTVSYRPELFRNSPKMIVEIKYYSIADNTTKVDTIYTQYSFEGNKLSRIEEKERGSIGITTFQYDQRGRIKVLDHASVDGSYNTDFIEFDAMSGRVKKKENKVINQDTEYTYYTFPEEADRLEMHAGIESDMSDKMEYTLQVKGDSVIVKNKWYLHDQLFTYRIEVYDIHNRLCSITWMEQYQPDRKVNFTYDSLGNMTSAIEKDLDNTVGGNSGIVAVSEPNTRLFTYEYDSHGNWISCIEKSSGGKQTTTTKRKITY